MLPRQRYRSDTDPGFRRWRRMTDYSWVGGDRNARQRSVNHGTAARRRRRRIVPHSSASPGHVISGVTWPGQSWREWYGVAGGAASNVEQTPPTSSTFNTDRDVTMDLRRDPRNACRSVCGGKHVRHLPPPPCHTPNKTNITDICSPDLTLALTQP